MWSILRAKFVSRVVVLLTRGIKRLPLFELKAGFKTLGDVARGGEGEPRQQSRFPSEPAWAHSRHVGFQILVPRGQHPNVPQDRRVQHGDVVQVADDELGESGPLVGESPLSVRLDRTGVPDELLAQGEHELVLGDVSRVGIEAARYQLGIRSGTGISYGLEELAEKSRGAGARRERHYIIGLVLRAGRCTVDVGCRSRDMYLLQCHVSRCISAKRFARTLSPEPGALLDGGDSQHLTRPRRSGGAGEGRRYTLG